MFSANVAGAEVCPCFWYLLHHGEPPEALGLGLLSLFAWSCSLGNTPVGSSPPCLNPSLCGWKFPETHCHADRDHCHFMTPKCGGWGPAVTVPVGSAHLPAFRLCRSPTSSSSSLLADGLPSHCTEALKHLGGTSAHCLRPSGLPTPFRLCPRCLLPRLLVTIGLMDCF